MTFIEAVNAAHSERSRAIVAVAGGDVATYLEAKVIAEAKFLAAVQAAAEADPTGAYATAIYDAQVSATHAAAVRALSDAWWKDALIASEFWANAKTRMYSDGRFSCAFADVAGQMWHDSRIGGYSAGESWSVGSLMPGEQVFAGPGETCKYNAVSGEVLWAHEHPELRVLFEAAQLFCLRVVSLEGVRGGGAFLARKPLHNTELGITVGTAHRDGTKWTVHHHVHGLREYYSH